MVPIESDGDLHVALTPLLKWQREALRLTCIRFTSANVPRYIMLKRNDRLEPLQPRLQPKKCPGDPTTSTCKSSKAAIYIVPASITAPNEHIVHYNFVLLIDGSY